MRGKEERKSKRTVKSEKESKANFNPTSMTEVQVLIQFTRQKIKMLVHRVNLLNTTHARPQPTPSPHSSPHSKLNNMQGHCTLNQINHPKIICFKVYSLSTQLEIQEIYPMICILSIKIPKKYNILQIDIITETVNVHIKIKAEILRG